MVKEVKDTNEFDQIINSQTPVVVKFGAEWCGPCRQMKPTLEQLSETVDVYDVDVDKQGELAQKFGVRGIPTTFVFKGGEVMANTVGHRTVDELTSMVEEAK